MNIEYWQKQAIASLYKSRSPKCDVEVLLSYVLGKERSWILAFKDIELNTKQLRRLNLLLKRRIQGEPIAYLVGQREFWSLTLYVNNTTFIPRPDTEILVEQALIHIPSTPSSILDLGTGTGAIALALASERMNCQVIGCDRISSTVKLAHYNAKQLHITNVFFQLSNWFIGLSPQLFEVIISNPPYIDINDEHLHQGEIRFEPASALVSKDSGLADLHIIISTAQQWLKPKGWLLLEHGHQQGEIVRNMMKYHNYRHISTINDYGGNPRVTLGQNKSV